MDRRISEMRNLGPVMERRLREIGVESERDLCELGSIAAWHRLRFVFGQEISLTALHAIEAALLDCDWRHLAPEVKARLTAEAVHP